jgi:hypothetical protein
MQTYYLSGSNGYTIRVSSTKINSPDDLTMSVQDMYTLQNSLISLSGINYNSYESLLSFTASIDTNLVGEEFRATLYNSGSEIWHGSWQVFRPQTVDKANYTNQNDQFISNVSENKYIILD